MVPRVLRKGIHAVKFDLERKEFNLLFIGRKYISNCQEIPPLQFDSLAPYRVWHLGLHDRTMGCVEGCKR